MGLHQVFRFCVAGLLLAQWACAWHEATGTSRGSDDKIASNFREGSIIDTATGEAVSLDQLTTRLLQPEVVYLGEEHHNKFHVATAVTVLQRLMAQARKPVLAMEMFAWDSQPAIERYVTGSELGREEFLEQSRWQINWGGAFEDYEPLVQYARLHHLSLVPLNPPKPLVRAVAKQGLEQARQGPEMAQWGMRHEAIVDDQAYRSQILRQLRACHDGGAEAMYQTMYEASMVRDEGMALAVVREVERVRSKGDPHAGPIVSYTGGGHIQYQLPIPKRVARRLSDPVHQLSIYMTAYDPERYVEVRDMIHEKIADYIWLTPVGAHGPPRRCR
jgi:uncharacterized iron-regulated protein